MIPAKYGQVTFIFIVSICMSCVVSGVSVLNSEQLKQRTVQESSERDIVLQEFVRSHNKEGKINYFRVVYDNTKID